MTPEKRSTLALSGFMGVGKSSVAVALATRTGAKAVDLDAAIEERAGMTIATIFAQRGEPAFRQLERERLGVLLDRREPQIIALGGGALVDETSRARALEAAFVVTLTAEPETIARRCAGSDRPLLAVADPRAAIAELLLARRAAYADCHLAIATDDVTPEAIATQLAAIWSPAGM